MALTNNMTQSEMIDFINHELLPQVKLEIQNWVKPHKKQGGYFVTIRQIMCMVDFLGAVYCGYPKKESIVDKRGQKIASAKKAIKFITDFFEPKITYHDYIVKKLYDMYRNGLVHLYQPKILKFCGGKLQWFCYKGSRHINKISMDTNNGKVIFNKVNHLQIMSSSPQSGNYYLPISIYCLYDDFEKAVISYRDKLARSKKLQLNWRTTVNAICNPR